MKGDWSKPRNLPWCTHHVSSPLGELTSSPNGQVKQPGSRLGSKANLYQPLPLLHSSVKKGVPTGLHLSSTQRDGWSKAVQVQTLVSHKGWPAFLEASPCACVALPTHRHAICQMPPQGYVAGSWRPTLNPLLGTGEEAPGVLCGALQSPVYYGIHRSKQARLRSHVAVGL